MSEENFPFEKNQQPEVEPTLVERMKAKESVIPVKRPAPIEASAGGLLVGQTFEEMYRLANVYSSSGLMPKNLNTPQKVLVAMQLLRELKLPVISSIGKVCVFNGVASIFGDLPLSLVFASREIVSIEEVLLDDKNNILDPHKKLPDYFAAKCTVKRKGMSEPTVRIFSKIDATTAGLWGFNSWVKYPKRMMQMRSRSWALKDLFPDVLSGVSILEYDHNTVIEDVESKLTKTDAGDELNNAYLPEAESNNQHIST